MKLKEFKDWVKTHKWQIVAGTAAVVAGGAVWYAYRTREACTQVAADAVSKFIEPPIIRGYVDALIANPGGKTYKFAREYAGVGDPSDEVAVVEDLFTGFASVLEVDPEDVNSIFVITSKN